MRLSEIKSNLVMSSIKVDICPCAIDTKDDLPISKFLCKRTNKRCHHGGMTCANGKYICDEFINAMSGN